MTEMRDAMEGGDSIPDSGGAALAAPQTTLGRCLVEARQARGLSIADVAQAIKFSPRQIEAIESDDFAKLPGATIVRGFIRSYAKLLRLDPATLLAMFDKQVPQVVATMQVLTDTGAALPQTGDRNGPPFKALLLAAVLAMVITAAGAYYYWPLGLPAPAAVPAAMPAVIAPVSPPPSDSVAAAAPVETPAAVAAAPGGAELAQPQMPEKPVEPSGQAAQSVDPDVHQLIFVFEGKSWVEVKDSTQRIVFAQNNLPGTRQVVNGKPPFAVVIGNASHVQLLYEERQIDLQPYTKVDVARFNLE